MALAGCKAHLGAKTAGRDPDPEKQAKKVLLNKWKPRAPGFCRSAQVTPDAAIGEKFRETFAEPLSLAKRAAMHEMLPEPKRRSHAAASVSH